MEIDINKNEVLTFTPNTKFLQIYHILFDIQLKYTKLTNNVQKTTMFYIDIDCFAYTCKVYIRQQNKPTVFVVEISNGYLIKIISGVPVGI